MRSVLFICHANLCRSPLAAGLCRARLLAADIRDLEVLSAGIDAFEGSPPHPLSVAVALERGVTLEGASRQLLRDDLSRATTVIVMDRGQLRFLERMMGPSAFASEHSPRTPSAWGHVRRLRELIPLPLRAAPSESRRERSAPGQAPPSRLDPLDLPDPYRGDIEDYRACAAEIALACDALAVELKGPTQPDKPK